MSLLKTLFLTHLRQLCASLLMLVVALPLSANACLAQQTAADCEVGFLLAAPDRGFMGNEEIRDAFDLFAKQHNAALLHVTDARTRDNLQAALTRLQNQGAKRVVILPLFYSEHEASYQTLRSALKTPANQADKLSATANLPVEWARSFGASYFAVEALSDRLHALNLTPGKRLIVVGSGASDATQQQQVAADLRKIAQHASTGLGFARIDTAVWPESRSAQEADLKKPALATLQAASDAVVVQLHLAKKLDSMMAFSSSLKRLLPATGQLLDEQTLTPLALTWMQREANRHLPLASNQVGVVIAAHGSDWHWNETMRNSVRSLESSYQVEYAFSMADAPVLERAVRRLDQRGVRAIVIVRIFGLKSSFQNEIEHLIGQDVETSTAQDGADHAQHAAQAAHSAHSDHGHGSAAPASRLRSPAVLSSAGGLDDHPLFARALLDRAQALSHNPKRETIILTAHGTGGDANNAQWLTQLESIAAQMRANGGDAFRAIRVATWREDWPDKRGPWVEKVRSWVKQDSQHGEVIVIPARTTGTGPEAQLLSGLTVKLGSGFAPHPLFTQWVEQQVSVALQQRLISPHQVKAPAEHQHHH